MFLFILPDIFVDAESCLTSCLSVCVSFINTCTLFTGCFSSVDHHLEIYG